MSGAQDVTVLQLVHSDQNVAMNPQPSARGGVRAVEYPEQDGNPLSDNTLQFHWITTIQGGLDAMFCHDPQVFVAGDLLWYPIEGDNKTRTAPDAMVAFGRPKGYRGSYRQWEEGDVAPQVVFEVLSPGNRARDLAAKYAFYDRFGVEEYYIYDPDRRKLEGYRRTNGRLQPIEGMLGWVSPRLGVRFEWRDGDLCLLTPAGEPFASYVELHEQREQEKQRADSAEQRAESAQQRAELERQRAESERQRAHSAELLAQQLAARLKALGIDPE